MEVYVALIPKKKCTEEEFRKIDGLFFQSELEFKIAYPFSIINLEGFLKILNEIPDVSDWVLDFWYAKICIR